ncbi:MAG: hypothetical protein PHX44_08180 [Sulfurimonas sp.]|uniref:hypothetical protein n=1 Tax=Sulfurimonas sp. TaxID=2022749 RepID=UPI00261D5F77|nr:hypothetical protein [Sulfurimonas sp.]MDD2653011.1 hypothetical protein [Sulfurimonas sp.]MDD3452457.1 hypothetical protein [Sulfurimonas sp.]
MKRIITSFLLLVVLVASLFGEVESTHENKYLAQEQPEFTEKFTCPKVKDGFFTRIYSVDYWSGTTTCLVFDQSGALDKVQLANPLLMEKMQDNLKKIKDSAIVPKSQNNGVDRYKSIENIRENYISNYTNGSGYLNLPSFLIAGLTLDNKVIDLASTVSTNTIKLQNGYSLYPNSYINFDVENDSHNLFMSVVYRIGNDLAGLVGIDAKFGAATYEKLAEEEVTIFSSTKEMLTNIIIFIIQFLERYNPTMLEIKTFLLFTVVPITTLFLVTSKATKKLSKIQDRDDILERAVVAGVALFCFYFTTNTVKIDDESGINQVNYQSWYRGILRSGSGFADSVGEAALDAFILYKTRDVGVVGEDTKRDLVIQKKMLESENEFLATSLKNGCFDVYNMEEVRNQTNLHTNLNLPFPPNESITRSDGLAQNWYSENFVKNGNPSIAISGCAALYKKEKENKEQLKELDKKMWEVADATNDKVINEQMEHLAKMQYRNFGELGWIAAPMIATTDAVMRQLDSINNQTEKLNREEIARDRELAGATPESNANIPSSLDDDLLKNVPYVLIPGFSSIKNEISGFFQKIPSLPDSGLFKNFAKFQSLGLDIVAYFWTLSIVKFGVAMLPFVMLLTASLLVIGFWAISVLLYYMVTPFLVAFALAANQTELIKKFLKTGVILAFKPLMLVVSIVIAIFAVEFLGNLNNLLIDWNFDNVKFLFTKIDTDLMYLMILKELLHIVNSIVIAFLAFYLVFNGSDMILNLIGLKDVSVDVQGSVGDKIDSKSAKYST